MSSLMTLVSCSLLAVAGVGPVGGDYGAPRVVVPAPENPRYEHLSWPKIVRTRDGALVVACIAGRDHHTGGSPAVAISTDGGQTFSPPAPLASFDDTTEYYHSGNLALGVAQDGALVLLAMAFTGEEKNSIFGWRSEDSGRTWQPVDTSALADNQTGSVYGHVFPAGDHGLAVCGHYRKPSRPHEEGIWIAFSADQGKTWGAARRITAETLNEPAMVYTQDRFIGLLRETRRDLPRSWYWQAVSNDAQTWRVEPGVLANDQKLLQPSPFLTVDPNDPNRLYALQSMRGVEGPTKGRIYLWTADAQRLDWQRLGLVAALPNEVETHDDWSYPWMTPLGNGQWFVVFYSGRHTGANSIYGMTLQPDGER